MAIGASIKEPFPGFPPPLTTRPEGLLSMLGLQTNGRYPQHFASDYLVPQLDLLPWYLESRAEIQTSFGVSTAALVVGGYQQLFAVPAQEVWILLAASIQPATIATAQTLQLCRTRSNDFLSRIPLSDENAFSATSQPIIGSSEAVRFLVFRPTVTIGLQGVAGTGVGNTINATLRFVRCTI